MVASLQDWEEQLSTDNPINPVKIRVKNEGKIKAFSDKQKLNESIASTFTLREMLKEVLQAEGCQMKTTTQRNKKQEKR